MYERYLEIIFSSIASISENWIERIINYHQGEKYPESRDRTWVFSLTERLSTVGSKIIRAVAIILAIFLCFDCNFYHFMLVINSIKSEDHDLTNKYSFHETAFRYEFLDTNYLKCSNHFAADCTSSQNLLSHHDSLPIVICFAFVLFWLSFINSIIESINQAFSQT